MRKVSHKIGSQADFLFIDPKFLAKIVAIGFHSTHRNMEYFRDVFTCLALPDKVGNQHFPRRELEHDFSCLRRELMGNGINMSSYDTYGFRLFFIDSGLLEQVKVRIDQFL